MRREYDDRSAEKADSDPRGRTPGKTSRFRTERRDGRERQGSEGEGGKRNRWKEVVPGEYRTDEDRQGTRKGGGEEERGWPAHELRHTLPPPEQPHEADDDGHPKPNAEGQMTEKVGSPGPGAPVPAKRRRQVSGHECAEGGTR